MFDVGLMSMRYKSSAFWPTAKSPISYILVGSLQIVLRACLKLARVGKDFFRSSLVRMRQKNKSMGTASSDLGLHSYGETYIISVSSRHCSVHIFLCNIVSLFSCVEYQVQPPGSFPSVFNLSVRMLMNYRFFLNSTLDCVFDIILDSS